MITNKAIQLIITPMEEFSFLNKTILSMRPLLQQMPLILISLILKYKIKVLSRFKLIYGHKSHSKAW